VVGDGISVRFKSPLAQSEKVSFVDLIGFFVRFCRFPRHALMRRGRRGALFVARLSGGN
jgi:hypothetical protein